LAARGQAYYNYKPFAAGLDFSYERGYTNVNRQLAHFSGNINFIYNYSPFIPITVELQAGTLSGGGTIPSLDKYGRQYMNHYKAVLLHGDFQLGEVIDYSQREALNFLKNFYFGTGVGLVFNNNQVQRYNLYLSDGPLTYRFPGSNVSTNVAIPFRFGYELELYNDYEEPSMAIDFGYTHSIVFGSGLDGYDDPRNIFKHNSNDQYRQFVIGTKFYFGRKSSYNKPIRYY